MPIASASARGFDGSVYESSIAVNERSRTRRRPAAPSGPGTRTAAASRRPSRFAAQPTPSAAERHGSRYAPHVPEHRRHDRHPDPEEDVDESRCEVDAAVVLAVRARRARGRRAAQRRARRPRSAARARAGIARAIPETAVRRGTSRPAPASARGRRGRGTRRRGSRPRRRRRPSAGSAGSGSPRSRARAQSYPLWRRQSRHLRSSVASVEPPASFHGQLEDLQLAALELGFEDAGDVRDEGRRPFRRPPRRRACRSRAGGSRRRRPSGRRART